MTEQCLAEYCHDIFPQCMTVGLTRLHQYIISYVNSSLRYIQSYKKCMCISDSLNKFYWKHTVMCNLLGIYVSIKSLKVEK